MKLLNIVASPRSYRSNTLEVSRAFLDALPPEWTVDTIDLFEADLPRVAGDNIHAKYNIMVGSPIDPEHKESWEDIEALIRHFVDADMYLISTPMWNFTVPYALKYYIDCLVQPTYTFTYNESGQPIPLVTGKPMTIITTRGGDYSPTSPAHGMDHLEPYLRDVFGFIGFTGIMFINAQPMDVTTARRDAALDAAVEQAETHARNLIARVREQVYPAVL